MKLSQSYFYTLRENVKDEDSTSSNLLVRAGYIKKTSSGIYMYLPLGFKVLKNIENIIREEMNKTGAQEVFMPALISEEYYIESGRRDIIGTSMFSLKDRYTKPFVLGPTHEELFAVAAGMKIRSYKDMPFNLYQFQDKFRDEARPRYGLIRVKEFLMKDAYSFDTDLEGLDISYKKMFDGYKNSFDRMGLNYKVVTADTGIMGGLLSEEWQAISDIGEDVLVLCDKCDYASNIEVSKCVSKHIEKEEEKEKTLINTPDVKTIEEVSNFLGLEANKFVKTIIYNVDGKLFACLVSGDCEVNETKVRKLLDANEITIATGEEVFKVTQAPVGFAGPIGIDCEVIVDQSIPNMSNFVVGANQKDYHFINVNITDFNVFKIADITNIKENDQCPICGGNIYFKKGIEIGNTFKLGTKYSKALNLQYSDSNNELQDVYMGSYGIGVGRCIAALAEQFHDDNGLIWSKEIAPYKASIIVISTKDEQQLMYANNLYQKCLTAGIEVILDDRDERPGVKFKDSDLIGIPLRIVVGKHIIDNKVELKYRDKQDVELLDIDEAFKLI